jgi:serine/threonine protein kinase
LYNIIFILLVFGEIEMRCGDLFKRKYKIHKILGSGGMGKVYLAENINLGTFWAIKEVHKQEVSELDFLAEANILKKLSHPALPRIFDVIEEEDRIFVIFDYIEGTPLDKKLEQKGKFSEQTVICWTKQICEVLIYLHSIKPNPIIYRDMKPSNIILAKDGSIKLIDFGIARLSHLILHSNVKAMFLTPPFIFVYHVPDNRYTSSIQRCSFIPPSQSFIDVSIYVNMDFFTYKIC